MKKFLTVFFVTLGIIFFICIVGLAYLWLTDPLELKPLLRTYGTAEMDGKETVASATDPIIEAGQSSKNTNLTPAQEDALELIGINPMALPETITPEQMSCFVRVLGEARVAEIRSGASPSAIEIFKAKECL